MDVHDRSRRLRFGPEPTPAQLGRSYDACVVGSGAAGALVAWELARAGMDVVVVERGPFVDEATSYDDLVGEAEPAWVRQANGTWSLSGYPWTTCNVGGGTVFYGGISFRHRPADFDASPLLGDGELPMRWPWSPAELAPYYDEVERLVGVAGERGADPALPPGGDPYPLPAVEPTAEGAALASAAAAMGLRPFPTPLAVLTRPYQGRAACTADRPCISHRCDRGAKGDAATVFLEPALATGHVELLAGLKAERLERGPGGEATVLRCVRVGTHEVYEIRAATFFVACNAVQSAALLLRSGLDDGPGGELIGRGLCFKLSEYLVGFRRLPPDERAPDGGRIAGVGPASTVSVTDHYVDDEAPGGLGGVIYDIAPDRPYPVAGRDQIIRIECLVPDEPRRDNRVRLAGSTGPDGIAHVVMDYLPHPRDVARLEYLCQRGAELLRRAGCEVVTREPSGWQLGSSHLHGTCRAGADPASGVTDADGRLWAVPNVHVADGGLLPFPGAVNPTLSIQAVALRVARRFLAARGAAVG